MPKEKDLEVKVGAFVLASIVCLVAFIFSISDFSVFRKGVAYRVVFQYANGLKKGAPVRLAGVDAGHVKEIKVVSAVERTMDVIVDIWMEEGVCIPADSRFLINQLGILGEKYIEIIPGKAPDILTAGTRITGEDPIPMEAVVQTFGVLGKKAELVLDGVNNGILSESNRKALAVLLVNVAAVSESLNKGVLTEANKSALAATLANMAAVSGNLKNGQGTVGKFLTDPSVFQNLDELSADLKTNPWKLFYRPKK